MSSVLKRYAARMLQFSTCLYACLSPSAWADETSVATAPYGQVISLPEKPARPSDPALADQAWWLSAGIGAAHVSTYNALALNLGLYGSADRFVYGFRYSISRGTCCRDIRYGNEQALMFGSYLDKRNMTWAGLGIARVDSTGGRHPDQRHIDVGLPLEFVFSPPGRYFAPEFRANVDLNKYNSFAMITVGIRFGQLK